MMPARPKNLRRRHPCPNGCPAVLHGSRSLNHHLVRSCPLGPSWKNQKLSRVEHPRDVPA